MHNVAETEQEVVLKDEQVLAIRTEGSDIVTRAERFQIVSEKTAGDANQVLHWIAEAKKRLEERRKFFVQPLNEQVKKINALFKTITEPIEKADGIIRLKVVEWRVKIEEAARKKEEELRRKAEKQRQKEIERAQAKGEAPPPPAPIPTIQVPKTVEGVTTVKRWTYAIEDISKVPRDFLVLDSGAVMRAIREGVREIPGLQIYQEETIKVGG